MNISDTFTLAAQHCPNKTALVFQNDVYSYSSMDRCINGIAGHLIRSGATKGTRIALYMKNRPEWILFYYGSARIGAIPVCIPSAFKEQEVSRILRQIDPLTVFLMMLRHFE